MFAMREREACESSGGCFGCFLTLVGIIGICWIIFHIQEVIYFIF